MSNNIFCARAEPAGRMSLALSSYQIICNALIGRMKAKLNTEDIYLLTDISNAIYQLEFCEKKFNLFKCDTRNFSKNFVFALQENSNQMLETVRRFDSFIRPVEHDWVTIPREIKTQCNFVCDALFLVAAQMVLLNAVATLSHISRSEPNDLLPVYHLTFTQDQMADCTHEKYSKPGGQDESSNSSHLCPTTEPQEVTVAQG